MADNSRPVAEPLRKGAQAAQAVRGAVFAAGRADGAVCAKPQSHAKLHRIFNGTHLLFEPKN